MKVDGSSGKLALDWILEQNLWSPDRDVGSRISYATQRSYQYLTFGGCRLS